MNELLDKVKILKLIDGIVDFCTFEIEIYTIAETNVMTKSRIG